MADDNGTGSQVNPDGNVEKSAHAQSISQPSTSGVSSNDKTSITNFVNRGTKILETFSASIRTFESEVLEIRNLKKQVEALSKRKRTESSSDSSSDDGSNENDTSGSDVDNLLKGPPLKVFKSHGDADNDAGEDVLGIGSLFEEEEDTGEPIKDQIAAVVNKSLRRTHIDKDKYKELS